MSRVMCQLILAKEKVMYKMDCYVLHALLLVTILLFITAIICYHYKKRRAKQKRIDALTMQKCRIINFKKFALKIARVFTLMT